MRNLLRKQQILLTVRLFIYFFFYSWEVFKYSTYITIANYAFFFLDRTFFLYI